MITYEEAESLKRVGRGPSHPLESGRFWAYVRDDRPSGDETPAAVWFAYSPNRRAAHPTAHLKHRHLYAIERDIRGQSPPVPAKPPDKTVRGRCSPNEAA